MSWFSRFSAWARAFYEHRKRFWKSVGVKVKAAVKSEWAAGLKDFCKTLAATLWGQVWAQLKEEILAIVLKIAKGEGMEPGESKLDAFKRMLKEVFDANKDGHITWEDLDDNVIDQLRSNAVAFFRSLGDNDEDRIKMLEDMISKAKTVKGS